MSIRACLFALAVALVAPLAEAAPPSEQVLPASTQGFLSIPDLDALSKSWQGTELGKLLSEPMMEAFNAEVERFVRNNWAEAHQRLGIEWDDLKSVPRGELAVALAVPENSRPAFIVLMDVNGNMDGADTLIAKVTKSLTADGAKRRHAVHADTDITVFETPPPRGAPSTVKPKQTALFVKDETLVASDSLALIQGVLDRWSGEKESESLGGLTPFQESMARSKPPADAPSHIRWYVNPLGFAAAQRELHPPAEGAERDMIKVLRNQGFSAIQGAGGTITLGQAPYDAVHRTFVYAPRPYELAMRMLDFPNDAELEYPDWVPADVALAATMRWEMQNAFDAFGTLFDEYIGDKGAFADVLDSIKTDPDGPQVDIRQELIAHLGGQATLMTDHVEPIAPDCQRNLFAAATTDEALMAKAIERVLKDDPSVERHELDGITVWEIKEEEIPEHGVGSLALEGAPQIGEVSAPEAPPESAEEEMDGGLPRSAICVAHGHLMIASHLDYLEKILNGAGQAPPLKSDPLVAQSPEQLAALGIDTRSMRLFVRSEKALRPNYELLRMGKAADAKSPLGRLVKTLGGDPEQQPKQKFDGSKLPEFDQIAERFGTHSAAVKSEEDGWLIVGFSLPTAPAE